MSAQRIFSRKKCVGVARVVLREGKEPRVRGGEKGSFEGREKKGL